METNVISDPEVVQIELQRGSSGLGFNIRGGRDLPHVDGDSGIFVTRIRDTGTAAEDGRLKEGDKILEINGTSLVDVTHQEAVNLFVQAGDKVVLKVVPGAEARIKALNEQRDATQGSSRSILAFLVLGTAILGIAGFVGYRYFKSR